MRNILLMTTLIASAVFVSNAWAATDESHCAQYCKTSGGCDCEWNETTNTLKILSGEFGDSAFSNQNYNIVVGDKSNNSTLSFGKWAFGRIPSGYSVNVEGNGASFGDYSFYQTHGTANYSGNGATFGEGAFRGCDGTVNYSGNNATFGSWAFEEGYGYDSRNGNIVITGENLTLGSRAFEEYRGSVTFSPDSFAAIGSAFYSDWIQKPQIYCTTTPSECNAALAALGINKTTQACTTTCPPPPPVVETVDDDIQSGGTSGVDGGDSVGSNGGNGIFSGERGKRIYTVQQANEVAGKKNKVMIRYK